MRSIKRDETNLKTIKPFEGVWFLFKISWKYNKRYLVFLFLKELFSVGLTIATLFIPKYIINAIFEKGNYLAALLYLIALIAATLICGLLQVLLSNRLTVEKNIVYKKFQLELTHRIMSVRYERTETAEFLNLKAKAEQFISTGGAGFGAMLESVFALMGTIATLAFCVWYVSQLSFLLILAVLILTAATIVLNYSLSKKNIQINLEKSIQERRAAYFSLLTQHFKFGKEIRGNGCDEWVSNRYGKQLNFLQRFYEKLARYGTKYGSLIFFASVAQKALTYLYLIYITYLKFKYCLPIPFGVSVIRFGAMKVGDFSVYLNSVETFSGGLKSLVGGIASIHQYNKYYESFKEYYALSDLDDASISGSEDMPDVTQEMSIRFNDVTFKYPGTEYEALSHITCEIEKGDILSIVGDNGAGKSTFIKLLLRLYEPTSGTITINGVDVSKIDRREYAKHFACVFQDFQLLSFSLKDNISLGVHETDPNGEAKVDEAIAFAGLTEKVESLEKGKETMIYREFDNNGYTPSGGEGQRLALARAVYRDSEILILDEPTASLDPNIEYELNQRIRSRLHGKKTIINVSHRLHSVRFSNKIFVFRAGKLIESGSHETLFSKPTVYRRMFERQASDYVDMTSLE
jgi:ATP-binding cassette subfamily B protein/ATP-binding cassette subfamily C protein